MTGGPDTHRRFGWLQRAALAAALLIAVGLAYHAAPANGFHFDDSDNILRHAAIHLTEPSWQALYRAATEGFLPRRAIPNLSFAIDWWRGDGSPQAFQITNVIVHAVTALAVLCLLQTVLSLGGTAPGTAWIAATLATALWALHPIQVQAVTYIVQRMTALAALFMLIAVIAYIRARRDRRVLPWMPLALVSSVAACLSKENAYVLPLLFLLAEYTLCRPPGLAARTTLDKALLALPGAIAAYVALDLALLHGPVWDFIAPGYAHRDFTLTERLLTQPRVIFFHLGQILLPLPTRFSIEHDLALSRSLLEPWTTLPALAGLVAWILAGVWLSLRERYATAGFFVLWIPATLAIESSIVPLEMIFEHRMYLPSVGLAGLAALAIRRLMQRGAGRPALGVGLLLAALLLTATIARVPAWRSSVTLYEQAVRTAPGLPRAWANLATAYAGEDRHREAIAAYDRAIELDPGYALAYLNRGSSHRLAGNLAAAGADYRRFIALQPDDHRGPYALGTLLGDSGRLAEAEHWLLQAGRLAPNSPQPYRQLALVYLSADRPAEAVAALHTARQRDPAVVDADYFETLGIANARLGRFTDAIAAFEAAVAGRPGSADTYTNLGFAHLRNGNPAAALAAARRALAIAPDDARAARLAQIAAQGPTTERADD